jgi:hypothetical protein
MALPGTGAGRATDDLDDDGVIDASEQLSLADADERLPWLESDGRVRASPASTPGRIVAFAAVGLLSIVLLLGALYLFHARPARCRAGCRRQHHRGARRALQGSPDGSRRPRGLGHGRHELQGRRGRRGRRPDRHGQRALAEHRPQPDRARRPWRPVPRLGRAAVVGVQVGAYSSRAQAEGRLEPALGSLRATQGPQSPDPRRNRRQRHDLSPAGGRRQRGEADTLCRSIKAAGGDCQVKR